MDQHGAHNHNKIIETKFFIFLKIFSNLMGQRSAFSKKVLCFYLKTKNSKKISLIQQSGAIQ